MDIPIKELKALLQKSGNRCAFSNCGEVLLEEGTDAGDPVVLSKIAHILAESPDGPRGWYPLPPEERKKGANLLLLCGKHHDIIDRQPQFYTVERLRQIKEDHEGLVRKAMGDAIAQSSKEEDHLSRYVREGLFSTLFPVVTLPKYVYSAPCKYVETQASEIRRRIVPPRDQSVIYPYVIRGGNLYAFQDLGYRKGPFCRLVRWRDAHPSLCTEWWDDPIKRLWFVDLLNRSLNKLTGRKGLQWDKAHHRYYFQPDKPFQVKEIAYRPLNQASASKQVVWQPVRKQTGERRPYWLHRAVNLRFHHMSQSGWCLSVRPEFRVTKDGFMLEESEKIGSRITRKKSRMFNYDLLGEVNFWRDFLSDSGPRIILNFDRGQHIILSTTMMTGDIDWPGIPEKYARPFKNVDYAEDLFSWAKLAGLETDLDDESEEEYDDKYEDEDGENSEDGE